MSAYAPSHNPPLWWERAIAHSPSVLIAVWSIIVALQIIIDPWIPRALFSISLGELPPLVAIGLGCTIGIGGATALHGLLSGVADRPRAWAIEKAGNWLLAAGWTGYSIVVLQVFPGSTISWGSSLMLALAAMARIGTLVLIERRAHRLRREAINTGQRPVVSADE